MESPSAPQGLRRCVVKTLLAPYGLMEGVAVAQGEVDAARARVGEAQETLLRELSRAKEREKFAAAERRAADRQRAEQEQRAARDRATAQRAMQAAAQQACMPHPLFLLLRQRATEIRTHVIRY